MVGILYGAVLAFGQTDLKRLVAYTSVSHLGFVLLGIFAWNELALQGAVMTMICHGISTGALFILVGALQERIHTREMDRMGGLWTTAPRLSGAALFFALASLGLPGLGDFVGEFLVLLGTYKVSIVLAALATVGVLFATFYALRLVQRAFQGPNTHDWRIADLVPREGLIVALMIVALLWLGLYPRPVLDTFQPAMARLEQLAVEEMSVSGNELIALLPLLIVAGTSIVVMLAVAAHRDHRLSATLTFARSGSGLRVLVDRRARSAAPGHAAADPRPLCAVLHRADHGGQHGIRAAVVRIF